MIYKKIDISFPITDELEDAIDAFMNCINFQNKSCEDCYRDEIDFWLKDMKMRNELTSEQFDLLSDYYVWGEIYKQEE